MDDIKTEITRIARTHLGVETLETRGRDSLDFHSVSVEGIRQALLEAWMCGIQECEEQRQDNLKQEGDTMAEQFFFDSIGEPFLKFTQENIAGTSNDSDRASGDWSGETGRWTTLRLYKTDGGKFICQRIDHTQWTGEHTGYSAEVCDSLEAVQSWFGHGRLAKEIYYLAKIEAVEQIA